MHHQRCPHSKAIYCNYLRIADEEWNIPKFLRIVYVRLQRADLMCTFTALRETLLRT
jgi:hypothetical protein